MLSHYNLTFELTN